MADENKRDDLDSFLGSLSGGLGAKVEARLGPAEPVPLANLSGKPAPADPANINLLYDVELEVKIELGRTMLSVEEILRLREGSIIQLEKDAGAPVDIYINNRLVAEGEVLVLNDYFCVRVTSILSNKERAISRTSQ
ncbi:MAG: flagellar motor switch protein FliN [Planctomycetota bacterium]|jgi:flagellar motor switch protein FliN/FliY|nr:flagellar motor switch protein FliN [Planctomycetota bacterium]